jgi:hypothetical protein
MLHSTESPEVEPVPDPDAVPDLVQLTVPHPNPVPHPEPVQLPVPHPNPVLHPDPVQLPVPHPNPDLRKYSFIFKTALAHESGGPGVSIDEKN